MLFAVNADLWSPLFVPKSKELRFIGLYHDDKENAIEHMIAQWIVDVVQSRDLVFRPSISTYTVKENENAVEAWTLFLDDVSYAFITTKNDVEPEVPMVFSYDHGRFHPDKAVELIKWDMDMVKRLIGIVDKNVDERTKAVELKGL